MATSKKKKTVSTPVVKASARTRLARLPLWGVNAKEDMLTQVFTFPTSVAALAFAAKVTVHAEVSGHYPTMELTGNSVKIRLGTTPKDIELAKRIDGLHA